MKTWEQRKLDNVAEFSKGRGYSKGDLIELGTPIILYGRLYTNYETSISDVDTYVEAKDGSVYSRGGEVIVPASGESAEDIARAATVDKSGILLGGDLNVVMPNEDINSGFLAISISNGNPQRELAKRAQGKSVVHIHNEEIRNLRVPFPIKVEQNKIVEYFFNLDHLITLHQRKCYRFIDIVLDAWEQRKFADMAIRESAVQTASQEIPGVEYDDVVVEEGCLNKDISSKETKKSGILFDGSQVLYGKLRPYLHNWLNPDFKGVAVGDWWVLKPIDLNKNFLYRLIQTQQFDNIANQSAGSKMPRADWNLISNSAFMVPFSNEEQRKIGDYFLSLDHLITLHQRKCEETKSLKKYMLQKMFPENGNCVPKIRFSGFADAWEQRKFGDLYCKVSEKNDLSFGSDKIISVANMYFKEDVKDSSEEYMRTYNVMRLGDIAFEGNKSKNYAHGRFVENTIGDGIVSHVFDVFRPIAEYDLYFWKYLINNEDVMGRIMTRCTKASTMMTNLVTNDFLKEEIMVPSLDEQRKIGKYLDDLDNLITLHQHKLFCAKNVTKYITTDINTPKKEAIMAELESVIEQKLIEQLIYGDSQWTYREDLKTEADLWKNFRYILEQNNKERLNGEPLSDAEFEQVKNQLQFSSFYKAGEWLVGENGKVMVHVQRDTERLHLVVMNHEHIAGGSSVYEVINQYNALKMDEDSSVNARDRRFDVTLMINGLPMIHIELKNKQHSYMDGFWQIKKYIGEGKFTGIFSAVQMFVISNGVDTKYFSAASDTELNPKFISGWLDKENNAVSDYLVFAKSVLRIPEAHEMIARYTVLDEEAKRLILLRPYQIHAIEAIRDASKTGKSGFVWHTTGSGKTLTSYKATRNLLMDIPAIDKAIFLIDRKDLDTQTTMAFQAYANNDLIDVDETDNVFDLKKKLKSDDRQVIVTTIQKLQRLITRKLQEGTPEYHKIKNLKIAFVVDECHRAVTPGTKREIERFFGNSLWYGFTGTPRFAENPYPQMGDLPRTTQELYGDCLHKYTIQNAIHDNAVLGFQVEHNGPKNKKDETDSNLYVTESHMLKVLEVILNKSYYKLGFQNGKGKTYEGLLTTSSIQLAQKYYDLLKMVKEGKTTLKIDEKIKQVLPDFPKFAITYSVTENEEGSHVNQQKMQESLDDYNKMFGTKYEISQIQGYNGNLNKRLARKDAKYKSRNEQLDLVIVVDRLLTGFDAPCLSTIFIDRPPMGPHDLIQAFSRTNRIYDKNKVYGQIVTFQAPKLFKESVDNAVRLYSAGSTQTALLADWKEVESAFRKSLKALRISAETPEEVPGMSIKEKKIFVKLFQDFDKFFAQLKSFTQYEDNMLAGYGITEDEYTDYAGQYLNAKEEIKEDTDGQIDDPGVPVVDEDYELMAYSHTKIDYEYIINLIQNIVSPDEESQDVTQEQKQKQMDEVKQYVEELRKDNPKVAEIMTTLIGEIEQDVNKYKGQSILNIVENMKQECIEKVVTDFCITWYTSKDDVMYAAMHYRNGEIPNESAIKETANFTSYKEVQERAIPKFKYYTMMIAELRKTLDEEIKPLMNH